MNLLFLSADTLGVELFQLPMQVVGEAVRIINVGPWKVEIPVKIKSDILTGSEATFWMTLGQQLKLYVIVREEESWLLVLDQKKIPEELSGELKDLMKELTPA